MNNEKIKVLPAGVPFAAAGAVWFVLAMILPVYKLSMVIIISVIAAAVCGLLIAKRNKQLALLPPPPTVKVRAEELAKKLDEGRDVLLAKAPEVASSQVRASITSIAATLEKIADEVEADPKDRNKARKLANHYVGMLAELVDKYLLMQKQAADGINITTSMAKIEEGLAGADAALKKVLDDLFTDEAMEVSADIAVLENLLNMETAEVNKMDFSVLE
ncbi:MAG: 5-bromo-4-chloroindolyl phosphate hydrolysis family protein [Firmicutes bacterium]|nr:5-bromo-4-chloroindolyl phosphate hydrolysis family protein [Bacillota bacterium]